MSLTQVPASMQEPNAQYTGFKNRIINGNMYINQRAFSSGTSGYTVDRWQIGGASAGGLVSSGLPNNFQQGVYVTRTSAAGTGYFYQNIESKNCFDLVGETVTVSFWAKATSLTALVVQLGHASATDNFGTVTTISSVTVSSSPSSSWAQYSATFTALPSGAANGLQVYIGGTTASTGTMNLTGVQLEKGSTATSFDYRPYGTELALCQRYYYKTKADAANRMLSTSGQCFGTTGWIATTHFPVTMRTRPTALEQSGTAGDYRVFQANTSAVTCNSVPAFNASTTDAMALTEGTVASGLVAGNATTVVSVNSSAYLAWSAEL